MSLFARQVIDFDISDRTLPFQDTVSTIGSPWHLPRIKQGSTLVFDIDLYLPDGNLANISSSVFTFAAQWRSRDRSANIEATGAVTVVSTSRIRVRIEASETAGMTAERGAWDCEAIFSDGSSENHKDTFIHGNYGLDREVTR